jgi:hypothetical protein
VVIPLKFTSVFVNLTLSQDQKARSNFLTVSQQLVRMSKRFS